MIALRLGKDEGFVGRIFRLEDPVLFILPDSLDRLDA